MSFQIFSVLQLLKMPQLMVSSSSTVMAFLAGHQVIRIMTVHPSFPYRQHGPEMKFWLRLHKEKHLYLWQAPGTYSKRLC